MIKKTKKDYLILFGILVSYFIISVFITYPLILNLKKGLWVGYGDVFGVVWGSWINKSGVADASSFTDIIAFPFGINNNSQIKQPVLDILLRSLTYLFNEITSYNLIILWAFPLTAFFAYILFRYLGFRNFASFVGGFIFGFNPSSFFQSIGGHPAFFFNIFIPILLLFLFLNKNKRKTYTAIIAGIAWALVVLSSLYFGYFSIFILILFILFDYKTSSTEPIEFFKNYGMVLVTVFVLVSIFEYRVVIEQFSKPAEKLIEVGYRRSLKELYVYSSRLYEFFIPQVTHPAFGDLFKNVIRVKHYNSNLFEQTLYLGFTPLIIIILVFYFIERGLLNRKEKALFFFFLSGFALMIILSFPPSFTISGIKIPLLSSFLYKVAPMFRVYSRTVIMATLFLSGITVLFLNYISKVVKKRTCILINIIVFILIGFEYWEYSGDLIFNTSNIPSVYRWLSKDKGSKVIVEYPMMRSDEVNFYTYLYYQRIHKKKLVNGALPGTKAWDFYKQTNNISDPQTVKLLKEVGTDYVIIHFGKYSEGMISYPLKRFFSENISELTYNNGNYPIIPYGLKLYKDFGKDKVYIFR